MLTPNWSINELILDKYMLDIHSVSVHIFKILMIVATIWKFNKWQVVC